MTQTALQATLAMGRHHDTFCLLWARQRAVVHGPVQARPVQDFADYSQVANMPCCPMASLPEHIHSQTSTFSSSEDVELFQMFKCLHRVASPWLHQSFESIPFDTEVGAFLLIDMPEVSCVKQ